MKENAEDVTALLDAEAVMTPEMLIHMIRITTPVGQIAVKGLATRVGAPYSPAMGGSVVYGELALGSALVSFRVPAEVAPQEGEAVVIRGVLHLALVDKSKDHAWRGNWKLTLIGQVVGKWIPRTPPEPVLPLPERGERIPLDDFISANGMESLLVLCTYTGQKDLAQSLSSSGRTERPEFLRANYSDVDAFLTTLESGLSNKIIRGLAIVRGGGTGLDVIGGSRQIVAKLISKGMPFYSALGHSTDIVLADRSADQVFHSPSELGAALARAVRHNEEKKANDLRIKRQSDLLEKRAQQLEKHAGQIVHLQEEARRSKGEMKARIAKLRNLLIGAAGMIALLLWWIVRSFSK